MSLVINIDRQNYRPSRVKVSLTPTKLSTIRINLTSSQPPRLLDQYYDQKPKPIYQLPTSARVKVMKGKFFYDTKTQRYAADPTNWWVSEKLDGIRAIWTGEQLLSRNGKVIHAPQWFLNQLPQRIALDGELYTNRSQFNQIQTTVMNHHPNDLRWKRIKFHVFDIPDARHLDFEDVQLILNHHLPKSPYLQVIHQSQIANLDQLLELQKMLVSQGAEGTMLRKPHSRYRVGETYHLLKFKTNFTENRQMVHLLDDLAIITGYKYNYQKLNSDGKPTIKSLQVHWVDTTKFSLDPEFTVSSQIRPAEKAGNYQQLFPIGQKVKIIYNQLFPSQKPRFPRYGGWVTDA